MIPHNSRPLYRSHRWRRAKPVSRLCRHQILHARIDGNRICLLRCRVKAKTLRRNIKLLRLALAEPFRYVFSQRVTFVNLFNLLLARSNKAICIRKARKRWIKIGRRNMLPSPLRAVWLTIPHCTTTWMMCMERIFHSSIPLWRFPVRSLDVAEPRSSTRPTALTLSICQVCQFLYTLWKWLIFFYFYS